MEDSVILVATAAGQFLLEVIDEEPIYDVPDIASSPLRILTG